MAAWCPRSRRARIWLSARAWCSARDGAGGREVRELGGRGGERRAGADRRPDRRQRVRQGDRHSRGMPYRRGQPSGGACADRAPARAGAGRRAVSLSAAAGVRRPLPVRRGRGRRAPRRGSAARVDDAAGEAFDKVAKLLGLRWPGGPALERLAACGDPGAVSPSRGRCWAGPGCDFSFSGLKTAVAQEVARQPVGRLADADGGRYRGVIPARGGGRAGRSRRHMRWRCSRSGHPERAAAGGRRRGRRQRGRSGRRWPRPPRRRIRAGRAAGSALHGQCGDGRLGRHRAAAAGPRGPAGFRATAALAAG